MEIKNQAANRPVKVVPKRDPGKKRFTIRHLWRMALWGGAAACALLFAMLTAGTDAGLQRLAAIMPTTVGHAYLSTAKSSFDAQAETRRLAQAVQDLRAQNGKLEAQLAEVEHNMADITGSVTRQIQEVKAETKNPWPADATAVPITPAIISSIVPPSLPAAAFGAPLPAPPQTSPAREAEAPAAEPSEYGADIGSALSIQVLRARWLGIHSAHAQLFEGLTPMVRLRAIPQSKHIELRLIVGPLADAAAAARICAALARYRLFCQPTQFDSQTLALR